MLTVSHNGELVGAVYDKRIGVLDVQTREFQRLLPPQSDWTYNVEFSGDDAWVVSSGAAGRAQVWSTTDFTSAPLATLSGHLGEISEAHFAPHDPNLLITIGTDGTARLWQLPRRTVLIHTNALAEQASVSPDGRKVVSINDRGEMWVWDLSSHKQLSAYEATEFDAHTVFTQAVWFPDGSRVALGSTYDSHPLVWTSGSDKRPASLDPNDAWVQGLAVSPKGDRIAMGDNKNRVVLWDVGTGRITTHLTGGKDSFRMLAVSFIPGTNLIAGAGTDGMVRIWDLGKPNASPRTLGKEGNPLIAIDVSRDGKQLVTTAVDHTLSVYRIRDGALLRTIQGPSNYLADVSFSRDGRMLAGAADNGSVFVWDWKSGSMLAVLHRHADAVNSIEFTADGGSLVTASDDGSAALFSCTTCRDFESVLDDARARVKLREQERTIPLQPASTPTTPSVRAAGRP